MSRLELRGASVAYGSTVALAEVSLSIPSGQVLAVVGPSGCGKSTLLRAVAGLEPLTAGNVSLGGVDLTNVATHQRDLGLMFQDHALFPHLSVADNVGFGLKMQGRAGGEWAPAERRAQRVEELLDLVGLSAHRDRPIDQLSGGEAQRVALARAVAPSPSLLMLDEPLGSLDRVRREQLTVELRALITELGLTALYVTHDQAEAFALADEVAVLRSGRVEQVGEPAAVWREPSNAFVAEFVGHPNLWIRAEGHEMVPTVDIREFTSSSDISDITASSDSGDISSAPTGQHLRRGVVMGNVFREGRHLVTLRSTDEYPNESIVFESSQRYEVGAAVSVIYAKEARRQLPPARLG